MVITDRGPSIDFGLISPVVLSSENDITRYFLPLKNGDVRISGELIRGKKELILGPRNPAVVIPAQVEPALCKKSFNREPGHAGEFLELVRKRNVQVEPEYFKGRGMNLFIPDDRMVDAGTEPVKLLSDGGFSRKYSIRFESGTTGLYMKILSAGREIVEIRAMIDANGVGGGNFYRYAFGNTPVEDLIARIVDECGKRLSMD